jgi:hypothetical protein
MVDKLSASQFRLSRRLSAKISRTVRRVNQSLGAQEQRRVSREAKPFSVESGPSSQIVAMSPSFRSNWQDPHQAGVAVKQLPQPPGKTSGDAIAAAGNPLASDLIV